MCCEGHNKAAAGNGAVASRFHVVALRRAVPEQRRSAEWQGAGVCGVPQPKHTTAKDGWQKMEGKK
jgi:hypothetical protein